MQLGSIMIRGMVIDMNDKQLLTLAQLRAFVDGTVAVDFAVTSEERYGFIARTLRRFGYARLKRPAKGVVLRFLGRVSGYSRQQLTRLVRRVRVQAPLLKRYRASRTSFARIFSDADVLLLAHTDTFGRRLRAAGVGEETRKVLLGHTNGDITTHYSAAELAALITAVNKIDRSLATPAITLLKAAA